MERLGLGKAALGPVEDRQIVEARRDIGVGGSERHLLNGEAPLVERLGLGIAALGPVEVRQCVLPRSWVMG